MIVVTEEELDELDAVGGGRFVLAFREMAVALNAACGFAFDQGRSDYEMDWWSGCCQECEQDKLLEDRCTRSKPSCHRHTS